MKVAVAVAIALQLGAPAWAQPRKTTLIYSGGSSLAVANHVAVARYVAQRVADELTNAVVLPIVPDGAPPAPDARDTIGHAIAAGGFTDVMVMGDDGPAGDVALEGVAQALEREWSAKGVHVYFIHAHEGRPGQGTPAGGMTFNADYLRRWAAKTVPANRRQSVEDYSELLFVDPDHKWLRPDMIPDEDRAVVNATLGKLFVETRVTSILDQIRRLSPSHIR
jgi:hypothetical protein